MASCRVDLACVPLVLGLLAGCDRVTLALSPNLRPDGVATHTPDAGDGEMTAPAPGTECAQSVDCNSYRPHCDVATQQCVECLSDAHCSSPEVCDLVARVCTLNCATSDDCRQQRDERMCDGARRLCVECRDDSQCDSRYAPFCRPESGQCVECLNAAGCSADQPFCDPIRNRCEQCLGDQDCRSSERCEATDHRCVPM